MPPRPSAATGSKGWLLLFLIPFVAVLWVPFYNRIEPTVFGVPFFYWYQLLSVVLTSVVIFFVDRRMREGTANGRQADAE